MKKLILLLLVLAFGYNLKADEGMFLLQLTGKTYKQMKAQGFRLKPSDVYNIKKSCLKDAIVQFGGYCTGEIVSENSLLFTNYHCGLQSIQQLSSIEHDYLTNGYWAQELKDELPVKGLYVDYLVEIQDVTDAVLKGVNGLSADNRDKKIEENKEIIIDNYSKKYSKENKYKVEVKALFEGNVYYLWVYRTYNDVRLVGAPTQNLGKFGGDTDNWMWPRHTCDFSIFRVYANKNGEPADYSSDNQPLKAKNHLKVNANGIKTDDFAMVMGFPGSTSRFSTSFELENVKQTNAVRSDFRTVRQDVLTKHMNNSDEVRIKYQTKYQHSSNYWKKWQKENEAFDNLNVISQKQNEEKQFLIDVADKATAKKALDLIEKTSKATLDNDVQTALLEELITSFELYEPVLTIRRGQIGNLTKEEVYSKLEEFYKDYDLATDKESAKVIIKHYLQKTAPENRTLMLKIVEDVDSFVDEMFEQSKFTSLEEAQSYFKHGKDDPVNNFVFDLLRKYWALGDINDASKNDFQTGRRLYMNLLMKTYPDKVLYPDANFTMRITYGNVKGYTTPEGKTYDFYTTLDEYIAKEDKTNPEFFVDDDLKEVYAKKDFGRWAENGQVHTCFLSTNDITGGNSGSPVLDGDGALIGLAFDGNSEAMSSDYLFDVKYQRSINLDVRFLLFVVDKIGNCQRLINELDFK